jgi:eukaryotic-like serine/threonine-protein kinase
MASRTHEGLLAGRYRILERIGAGGMATVFLAEDERLGRRVAVKRLHADSPEDVAQRFHREARLLASLSHPNVVAIFDTATDDDGVLIVMEHVAGETLRDALARGPLGDERALAVIAGVAAALDHAHERGVVHRDVKPANVLLGEHGDVKLADLGIATATESTQITRTGSLLGTPSYMAPEQLDGGELTPAVDVYALGTLAFEALSGRKARSGRTPVEIARRVVSEAAPDLREVRADLPEAAAAVLCRAMARDPAERHASAGELASDLARALGRAGPAAAGLAGAAGAGVAAGAAGAAAAAWPDGSEAERAEPAARDPERPEPERAAREPEPAEPDPERAAREPERAEPEAVGGAALAGATGSAHATDPPRGRAPEPPRGGRDAARRDFRSSPARRGLGRARRLVPLAVLGVVLGAALAIALAAGGGDEEPRSAGADAPLAPGESAERPAEREQPREEAPADDAPAGGEDAPGGAAPAPAEGAPGAGHDPALGRRLNDEGFALLQRGDASGAVPILQRAVAAFPPGTDDIAYAYALFNLGRALRLSGRPAEAIPILEQRLEIPNQTDVVQRELDLARAEASGAAPAPAEGDDGPGRGRGKGKGKGRD